MRTLACFSLAAGIGLIAALASIVDAVLFRPLPVARPKEIARVFTASPGQPLGFVSFPDFLDFRKAEPLIAECLIPVSVGEPPQMRLAMAVTADYFNVLGVAPKFGRTFIEQDRYVVVLARGTASDLGRSLRVAGKLYTVIGVAPENFGLDRFLHADLYIPIRSYGDGKILEDRSRRFLTVHVRGVNTGKELAVIAARLEREHPDTNRERRAVVLDEMTWRLQADKTMTKLAGLLGSFGSLMFAIACSNACGALLLRSEIRTRDTALKIALGAGRMRLLGESLREAGIISALSCAVGLPLAWIAKEALRRSIALPTDFAISIDARIDCRVALLAAGAACIAALFCGVAPFCARINVWDTLKSRERGTKGRSRNVLVIAEIALATVLLATGGSLWAGLKAAKNVDLGYHADHISVMTFDPSQQGYSEERTRAFYRDLMESVKRLPGVKGVALAQSVPLGMTGAQRQLRLRDQEQVTVWMNIVTPEYFDRMRIGFVQGRTFNDRDIAAAIVNEELAKRVRIGEKMNVGGRMTEVIGVVKTAKYMRWDEPPRPFFYLPYETNFAPRMTLHVESAAEIFRTVRGMARDVPMSDARMLREYFENGAMFAVKAALRIAAVAGGCGLSLSLVGLYGLVSSSVMRRRREIAIRVALGAGHLTIFGMVSRQGILPALAGAGIGVLLKMMLPVTASAWTSFAAVAVVMGASLLACGIPAAKVLRLDAAAVLKEE